MLEINNSSNSYLSYTKRKASFGLLLIILIVIFSLFAICLGPLSISIKEVLKALSLKNILNFILNGSASINTLVAFNIRLPRVLTAVIAGAGLAVSGTVMQNVLRNPLGSPFTLGISQGAAFGAAFAIIVLGAGEIHSSSTDAVFINNPYLTTTFAFIGALLGIFIILFLAKWRGLSPEAVILAGIAMGALFNAATTFIEFFATDTEVASVVFWLFGDIGRSGWREVGIMIIVTTFGFIYFVLNRWNYNALESGDETAKGLGVNTEKIRLYGMIVSSLIVAATVAFLGVIGFIGLVAPHITRRIIGNDQRFLIPISALFGSLLLLISDTLARIAISPIIIPVGIITSFIGGPLFLYILARRRT